MKLSCAHVPTACVRVQLQMEYTLKGYAFDCTHTLAYAYKNEVYFGLYASLPRPETTLYLFRSIWVVFTNDPTTVSVKFTTSAVKLLTWLISSKISSDMAEHLTRQSFPIKTDPFSVPLKAKVYFGHLRPRTVRITSFSSSGELADSRAPRPRAGNFLRPRGRCAYNSACTTWMLRQRKSRRWYCVCVEVVRPHSSAVEYTLKAARTWLCARQNAESEVYPGLYPLLDRVI